MGMDEEWWWRGGELLRGSKVDRLLVALAFPLLFGQPSSLLASESTLPKGAVQQLLFPGFELAQSRGFTATNYPCLATRAYLEIKVQRCFSLCISRDELSMSLRPSLPTRAWWELIDDHSDYYLTLSSGLNFFPCGQRSAPSDWLAASQEAKPHEWTIQEPLNLLATQDVCLWCCFHLMHIFGASLTRKMNLYIKYREASLSHIPAAFLTGYPTLPMPALHWFPARTPSPCSLF